MPQLRRPPRAPVGPVARWFTWYFRRLARSHFAGVHWSSAEDPAQWDRTPILVVANHSTWWDGPLAYLLSARLERTFQVAMEARHLARHPYFGMIGAHPLRRTTAAERYADLEWLGAVLTPGAMLWIFPQGERRSARAPLEALERGAAHLALTRAPVRVVPVAIRLAHLSEQLPEAFLRIGDPWIMTPNGEGDRAAVSTRIGSALARALEFTDQAIGAEALEAWRPLLTGTLSLNKRIARMAHAAGLQRGPFEARNG